jgi:hypothetical protein
MTAKILATKSLMNEHCELLQGSNYWAAQCFKAIWKWQLYWYCN